MGSRRWALVSRSNSSPTSKVMALYATSITWTMKWAPVRNARSIALSLVNTAAEPPPRAKAESSSSYNNGIEGNAGVFRGFKHALGRTGRIPAGACRSGGTGVLRGREVNGKVA